MVREDTEVPHLMLPRRRHQADQAGEEALGLDIDVGRALARGHLEEDADTTICEGSDSVMGERWPQHVAEHP